MSNLFILSIGSGAFARMTGINDALYELCNHLAGRSWLLDNLIALPLNNQFIKAAFLGGCFFAAWHGHQVDRNRRILLVSVLASVFVIATTKTLSYAIFSPRPFIQSQKAFHLEDNQLVESRRLPYRVPLDAESQKMYADLVKGDVVQNDLHSFPSDHAGFYVTLAVGILLASRALGWLAVSWTFLVLLGSRIITGRHSPLEVVVGAGIGIVMLLLFQFVFDKWWRRPMDLIVNWTLRHPAIATVLIFMVIFEASNSLQDVHPLLEIGSAAVKHMLHVTP